MTTEIWIEQAKCWRCDMIVPVGEIRNHRDGAHKRVKQSVGFRPLCPVCGRVGGSQRIAVFAGKPIENTCANGHEYLSEPMTIL